MKTLIHLANERGGGDYDWLNTRYSFSFSNYINPKRTGFGKLLVLNDDIVAPSSGFEMHPHSNMEIITIVTEGVLEHKDSEGNRGVVKPGEVQVMSAGSGVYHSEFNQSKEDFVKLFQIWINTKEKGIKPRYDNKKYSKSMLENKLLVVASGENSKKSLYIHQDAFVMLGNFAKGKSFTRKISKGNGLFAFVIEGKLSFGEHLINHRDSIEINDATKAKFTAKEKSKILLIEVPMK